MTYVVNAQAAKAWSSITEEKPAPADVDHWAQIRDKRALLEMA